MPRNVGSKVQEVDLAKVFPVPPPEDLVAKAALLIEHLIWNDQEHMAIVGIGFWNVGRNFFDQRVEGPQEFHISVSLKSFGSIGCPRNMWFGYRVHTGRPYSAEDDRQTWNVMVALLKKYGYLDRLQKVWKMKQKDEETTAIVELPTTVG